MTINNKVILHSKTAQYLHMTLDAKLGWKVHAKKKREETGLKYKKMYWLMGSRSALSVHKKLMLYKQVLKPEWTYGIQLGMHETAILTSCNGFKTRYLGTSLLHIGISETPTSIGTFKWRCL